MLTKKRLAAAGGTFALGLYLGLTPLAGAASPSEEACAGTFSKIKGTVTCTVVDPVGNSESSPLVPTRSQTVDTSDSEQGNLTPKDKNATTSTGPGNSQG